MQGFSGLLDVAPQTWAVIAYLAVNGLTFLLFGWDKLRAILKKRRTPEFRLLFLAFIGGSVGAKAGQKVFTHKTTKQPFARRLNRICAFHLVLLALWGLASFGAFGPAPIRAIADFIPDLRPFLTP